MENNSSNYVKVLFRYYSDVLDKITVETMWAEKVDEKNGIYKLNSIPFYGPLIATDDEFFAEFDESEQMLTYRKTTKFSGNSVVLISLIQEGFDREIIRNEFKEMGCTSEGANNRYFAMEVLESTNYNTVKRKLDFYHDKGVFDYAEPCLSEKHRREIE